jgi:segregation and condensation protein A
MRLLEEQRSLQNDRGNVSRELRQIATKALVDVELESITLFGLLKAFERVMQRFDDKNPGTIHEIVQFSYTIEEQQQHIYTQITTHARASFTQVFSECRNRIHAIVTFLAMLELLNMEKIRITVGEGVNNFWLEPIPEGEKEEEDIDYGEEHTDDSVPARRAEEEE